MLYQNLVITEKDFDLIKEGITRVVEARGVRSVLLIDKSGYIIVATGAFRFIPAEEIGVMAAGALSALSTMVDMASPGHLTIQFHSSAVDNIHFAMLNSHIFLAILYNSTALDERGDKDTILKAAQSFIKKVRPLFAKGESTLPGLGSLDFINEKIQEIFSKEE